MNEWFDVRAKRCLNLMVLAFPGCSLETCYGPYLSKDEVGDGDVLSAGGERVSAMETG